MYPVGIPSSVEAFLSTGIAGQLLIAFILLFFILSLCSCLMDEQYQDPAMPVPLPEHSLFTILPFFHQRFDFLNWGFRATGQPIFQFRLFRNTVIAVSGEASRRTFLTSKGLDLNEGFKYLSGSIPVVPGVTSNITSRHVSIVRKRLAVAQREERLQALIPELLLDCQRVMESWGVSGSCDPFKNIYELLFQISVRSLTCSEIADDSAVVARLQKLYDTLDRWNTPAAVLFPWLPSPGAVFKLLATKQIYGVVCGAINARQQSGISRNDMLQILLDHEDEHLVVVGFIMGLLVAGARATGATASWMITFLGCHSDWKVKAAAEIQSLISTHSSSSSTPSSTSHLQNLSERLSTIPVCAWESSTPILDAIIRETLRLAEPHTAMRRNLGPEVQFGDKVVPTGAFVLYQFSDVHLDERIYPNPWEFDPGRSTDSKVPFSWIGWGAGKTVCLGQRLAKLELKLIAAMFLLGMDFDIVDRSGKHMATPPRPNWNDTLLCQPQNGSFKLRFQQTPSPRLDGVI
ncbi:hypothetical protein JAAARDRAFT_155168 [Jaapia argillacea MUCL 33604]|uniref:Cytochrome P450 n=1 Tax=Jaapia argillacea MUCL 33604 TaxID=933084 RepID=A0A067PV69_9AGAM|nr:hypothetical protein JAAARDRAFT_155168 [Jaapia argillacea MUCL 33604]